MPQHQRLDATRIAIVGLGYVGLPLAVEFGKRYPTTGYDIHAARIAELRQGRDSTLEVEPELLAEATHLTYTDTLADIAACNVYIVTVPTPIDAAKRPDLTPLVKASEAIGSVLKPGDTVIYESTVYPGCTEEVCVPILERVSGLRFEAAPATAADTTAIAAADAAAGAADANPPVGAHRRGAIPAAHHAPRRPVASAAPPTLHGPVTRRGTHCCSPFHAAGTPMPHTTNPQLVGSLRKDSFNRQLATAIARLAPRDFAFDQLEIGDLPPYNQDDDAHQAPAVLRLKEAIKASQGVLFVTPEYNRSIPGVLKNAIDHASRPYGQSAWAGKPAGVIGVSVGAIGTALAQQHLRNVLAYLDMPTMGQPEAFLQAKEGLFDDDGNIGSASREFLQGWMDAYVAWVKHHAG
jgi:chromate reductase